MNRDDVASDEEEESRRQAMRVLASRESKSVALARA